MQNNHWANARAIQYELPEPHEYQSPLVDWPADPRRSVLLVHDMQRYFVERFDQEQAPGRNLISNIASAVQTARRFDIPVFYTAQPGNMTPEQRGLLKDFWGPGMTVAPDHRRVIDPLEPTESDLILDKWRYSAFARSSLENELKARNRDQIVLCGVYAHVGVLATALDSYSKDYQTLIIADAVADFDRERHLSTLDYLARVAARVLPTSIVLKEWKERHAVTAK